MANHIFFEQVISPVINSIKNYSERNAFCINEQFCTYQDFGKYISKIRKAIIDRKFETTNVGLVANDDVETYASIFALWLEGKSYVPLHPNQPLDRCNDIISQVQADLVLDSSIQSKYSDEIVIKTSALEYSEQCLELVEHSDDVLAYILFTSGSTGKPKGVKINRKNIGAFMSAFWETGININENDRCLQCFDLTFDVSVESYLVPLTRGACVFTIPHEQIKYSYVYGLLIEHKLTFGAMAPSMLRYLRPYFDEIDVDSMRYCIVTAEASPIDLIQEWSKCIPNADIYDFYGPTEATIYCTYYKIPKTSEIKTLNGMLSIGKELKGICAIIIDENEKILSAGEKGELCISGAQLTEGYWNCPQIDTEVFFTKKYDGELRRFYHTGDLCYYDHDGNIMYSGRLDFQAKIQGYRVELGEIEFHARECLHGPNAIAIAFENKTGNAEIALFVEDKLVDANILLEYLKSKIPYYMVPTKILLNNEFPLNSNGKIDRKMLKKLITL